MTLPEAAPGLSDLLKLQKSGCIREPYSFFILIASLNTRIIHKLLDSALKSENLKAFSRNQNARGRSLSAISEIAEVAEGKAFWGFLLLRNGADDRFSPDNL